jgi:hypothetical protein
MTQLSGEELWAQACVQRALPDSLVKQHDDGSRPSMYDLTIAHHDNSIGALEVTAAVEPEQQELWKLVGGRGKRWIEPDLTGGWLVRILPSTRAKALKKHLPELLRELERKEVDVLRGSRFRSDPLAARASELCVVEAQQGPTAHHGSIYVMIDQPLEQMGGFSPVTGDPLAIWLGEWLAEPSRGDNVCKLSISSANERHVFVLVPVFAAAPFAVIDLLISPCAPLPTIPVLCQNSAYGLACRFTLGGRADSSHLLAHGPGVRLAGAADARRCREGRGDSRAAA